jgi:hypothetical protein
MAGILMDSSPHGEANPPSLAKSNAFLSASQLIENDHAYT